MERWRAEGVPRDFPTERLRSTAEHKWAFFTRSRKGVRQHHQLAPTPFTSTSQPPPNLIGQWELRPPYSRPQISTAEVQRPNKSEPKWEQQPQWSAITNNHWIYFSIWQIYIILSHRIRAWYTCISGKKLLTVVKPLNIHLYFSNKIHFRITQLADLSSHSVLLSPALIKRLYLFNGSQGLLFLSQRCPCAYPSNLEPNGGGQFESERVLF